MANDSYIKNIAPKKWVSKDPFNDTEASNAVPPHHGLPYGLGVLEQRSGYFKVHFGDQHVVLPWRQGLLRNSQRRLLQGSLSKFSQLFKTSIKSLKV